MSRRAYQLISCFCALGAMSGAACATSGATAAKPAAEPAPAASSASEPEAAATDTTQTDASQGGEASPKTLRPPLIAADLEHAYLGVIDRAGLVTIIEQGLGRILARLRVSPAMERGKFQGFRVNGIDPAWAHAGIQANDVLLRLNGQTIERPEQAQAAFESLRVASELALELLRDGQKLALRYRIEGSSVTSKASAPR